MVENEEDGVVNRFEDDRVADVGQVAELDLQVVVVRDLSRLNLVPVRDFDDENLGDLPVVEDILLRLPFLRQVDVATEETAGDVAAVETNTAPAGDFRNKIGLELPDGVESRNVVACRDDIALVDDHEVRSAGVRSAIRLSFENIAFMKRQLELSLRDLVLLVSLLRLPPGDFEAVNLDQPVVGYESEVARTWEIGVVPGHLGVDRPINTPSGA